MISDVLSHPPAARPSPPMDEIPPSQKVSVLGVEFDCLTMPETLDYLERIIQRRKPRQICLSNAYIVALAQRDEELRQLLRKATLVLADGMSIVWGSRWIDVKIPERIAGPD